MSKHDDPQADKLVDFPKLDALRTARRDARFRLDVGARIHSPSIGPIVGHVLDISERGFSMTLPVELPVGEIIALNLTLLIGFMSVRATVRNRSAARHGFEFVEPNLSQHLIRENCCLLERAD